MPLYFLLVSCFVECIADRSSEEKRIFDTIVQTSLAKDRFSKDSYVQLCGKHTTGQRAGSATPVMA